MKNKNNNFKQDFGYITLPAFGNGFFSNYFCVLSMIIDAHRNNLKPYVDLRKTAFVEDYNPYLDNYPPVNCENTWDWWFDQETPLKCNASIKYSGDISSTFNYNTGIWKRDDILFAKTINDKYIHIKPHILNQVVDYYNKFLKNHITLGVMARGCEMNARHPQYGDQTIKTWIDSPKDILNKHTEIDSIFVVTEDSNYLPIFSNNFSNILYIKNVFRRTIETLEYMIKYTLWPCLPQTRKNHCRILGEECLVQALLLSKCDYLLVKQSGTSSAAIFYADDNLKDVFWA